MFYRPKESDITLFKSLQTKVFSRLAALGHTEVYSPSIMPSAVHLAEIALRSADTVGTECFCPQRPDEKEARR